MNKKFIKQIQKKVVNLLRKHNSKPLYLLAKDNCSELSRLTGCWILQKHPDIKISILQGKKVFNVKGKCHDILAVEYYDKIYLIDVTIWQFFKYKRNILIGITNNISEALAIAKKIYKGSWRIAEKLNKNDSKDIDGWKGIIEMNCKA